jgi:hypothetical protein
MTLRGRISTIRTSVLILFEIDYDTSQYRRHSAHCLRINYISLGMVCLRRHWLMGGELCPYLGLGRTWKRVMLEA